MKIFLLIFGLCFEKISSCVLFLCQNFAFKSQPFNKPWKIPFFAKIGKSKPVEIFNPSPLLLTQEFKYPLISLYSNSKCEEISLSN